MKAIETEFDGHRFRSRTEARWAVTFKAADIRYEYEKEGFELAHGRYLPDFWLPDREEWWEIKGEPPTKDQYTLIAELALETSKNVLVAIGAPDPRDFWVTVVTPSRVVADAIHLMIDPYALAAGKRARFEHGEKG